MIKLPDFREPLQSWVFRERTCLAYNCKIFYQLVLSEKPYRLPGTIASKEDYKQNDYERCHMDCCDCASNIADLWINAVSKHTAVHHCAGNRMVLSGHFRNQKEMSEEQKTRWVEVLHAIGAVNILIMFFLEWIYGDWQ